MRISTLIIDVVAANVAGSEAKSVKANGFIHSITYIKDPGAPFADTVDLTIKTGETLQEVWREYNITSGETIYPRPFLQKTDGTVLLYTGGEEVPDPNGFALMDEQLEISVAQPGTDKKGKFIVCIVGDRG